MQAGCPVDFVVKSAGKTDIKSLVFSELQGQLRELGEPSYRAGQITDWLYKKRVDTIDEMTNLPRPLRGRLSKAFSLAKVDIVRELGARDTTRKFLFRLADGNLIESVLIPASLALYGERSDRRTICVSTQVGCAYGCKFCASGLEGFSRNLSANEIVDQLIADNPVEFDRLKGGDQKVVGFFVGQAMKATQGKADGKVITSLLRERSGGG